MGNPVPLSKKISRTADQTSQIVSMALQTGALASHGDKGEAAFIVAQGAMTAINILATLVGNPGDKNMEVTERADKAFNRSSVIYAAMLSLRLGQDAKACESGIEISIKYSPFTLYEALLDTEKMLGRNIDADLDPNLVRTAREASEGSSSILSNFLATRGDKKYLN